MKKYMIVYEIKVDYPEREPVQGASFADSYSEALDKKQGAECGLGGYAEIYVREESKDKPAEYVLLEA